MFRALWSWIPTPYKLIGGGVALAGILYGLGLYRTSLIQKGIDQGKRIQIEADRKTMEADQARQKAIIEAERAAIAAEGKIVAGQKHEILRLQATAGDAYKKQLDEIAARKETEHASVSTIPSDELDDAIRAELAKIAARPSVK